MKVSYQWLKDYIDIEHSVAELADMLCRAGLLVESVEAVGDDSVLDIEITSNRPDWLSMIGVARELASITGKTKKAVKIKQVKAQAPDFSIEIMAKDACLRYVGKVIRNVSIKESAGILRKRLETIGSRSVNNAADITNFCMFETGQPLHAFDLDKLAGNKIIVRYALKGEEITTIDGVKRELDPSILVIADAKKPVAIAGIMGGIDTEVGAGTKNVLLESAYFDPVTIRRASRKLGLSSESNYRFERKVDIENVMFASDRAALLFEEITKGRVDGGNIDVNFANSRKKEIKFDPEYVSKRVGAAISTDEVKRILTGLDFSISDQSGCLTVGVPSFRCDVNIPEDLVEEVVRIWGYDKIKPSMPPIKSHVEPARSQQMEYKNRIRAYMQALGLDEVVTYTLLGKKLLENSKVFSENPVEIRNPLSCEQAFMKGSMLAGFLKTIGINFNRKVKAINIFEIGKIYEKADNGFNETEVLAIALCGNRYQNWQDHQKPVDFYDIKGVIEVLLCRLGIKDYSFRRVQFEAFELDQSVDILIAGEKAGQLGKIEKKVLKNFDIGQAVYFAQISIEACVKAACKNVRFTPLIKYPSSFRDVAIVIKESVPAEDALNIIKEVAAELAVNIQLFDLYQGDQVAENCKSLAFSIEYQSKEKTLTDEEVTELHSSVQQALLTRLDATLR
ncbi:MAG: phenylalanine--tRNA ligase subunit beta [Candidatus Omnitrophota bacterium]